MSFVVLGTPQPIVDQVPAKDRNKYLPIHLQTPRDEQGRNRLHGAFEGGWSAGYYNTVGSEKGWQPQHFTSSRSNRAEKRSFKPEDYMDEEDKRLFQRDIKTRLEYDVLSSASQELMKQKQIHQAQTSQFFSASLFDVQQIQEPIGSRLLKKMGYKEGDLIGSKKRSNQLKPVLLPEPRTTVSGLGYDPYKGMSEPVKTVVMEEDDYYLEDKSQYVTVLEDEDEEIAKPKVFTQMTGFIKSKAALPPPPVIKTPQIPKDFVPKQLKKQENQEVRLQSIHARGERLGEQMEPETFELGLQQQQQLDDLFEQAKLKEDKKTKPIQIQKEAALAALDGFKPFLSTPDKQGRYEKYLRYMAGLDQEPLSHPPTMNREDQEPLDYGPRTRTFGAWKPDKITCRRFGVGFVERNSAGDMMEKEALNASDMQELIQERDRVMQEAPQEPVEEEEEQVEIEVPQTRPPMDLFKAIFADSDEEPEVFKPVFTKPTKSKPKQEKDAKKKKIKLQSLEEFDDLPTRKKASDFM
ncbi:hypothetical protein EDD86DRAFT_248564 [Gorgonomyces haynaldii]|nr:hypothetical protein EDD86DRAFT_248564 [Gorgonomyces haynaldii]